MRLSIKFAIILSSPFFYLPTPTLAAEVDSYKTAGGLTAYLGVLPAAMIEGHDMDHPERTMHDGVPTGVHAYHVMVAVFDAESGARIQDAAVEAMVTPLGLSPVERSLDVMVIAGTVTYGNYFTMRGDGVYRIGISIAIPRLAEPVALEFMYEHRTR